MDLLQIKFKFLDYNYYLVIQIMTMNTIDNTTISSKIPTKIIDEIAKMTQRNRSFHIKKALELYLGNYLK
jgi:hypothetical protein